MVFISLSTVLRRLRATRGITASSDPLGLVTYGAVCIAWVFFAPRLLHGLAKVSGMFGRTRMADVFWRRGGNLSDRARYRRNDSRALSLRDTNIEPPGLAGCRGRCSRNVGDNGLRLISDSMKSNACIYFQLLSVECGLPRWFFRRPTKPKVSRWSADGIRTAEPGSAMARRHGRSGLDCGCRLGLSPGEWESTFA